MQTIRVDRKHIPVDLQIKRFLVYIRSSSYLEQPIPTNKIKLEFEYWKQTLNIQKVEEIYNETY